jgi:hypothetical protein
LEFHGERPLGGGSGHHYARIYVSGLLAIKISSASEMVGFQSSTSEGKSVQKIFRGCPSRDHAVGVEVCIGIKSDIVSVRDPDSTCLQIAEANVSYGDFRADPFPNSYFFEHPNRAPKR